MTFSDLFEGRLGDLITVVTLCAQRTRGLLAIAEFLRLPGKLRGV